MASYGGISVLCVLLMSLQCVLLMYHVLRWRLLSTGFRCSEGGYTGGMMLNTGTPVTITITANMGIYSIKVNKLNSPSIVHYWPIPEVTKFTKKDININKKTEVPYRKMYPWINLLIVTKLLVLMAGRLKSTSQKQTRRFLIYKWNSYVLNCHVFLYWNKFLSVIVRY